MQKPIRHDMLTRRYHDDAFALPVKPVRATAKIVAIACGALTIVVASGFAGYYAGRPEAPQTTAKALNSLSVADAPADLGLLGAEPTATLSKGSLMSPVDLDLVFAPQVPAAKSTPAINAVVDQVDTTDKGDFPVVVAAVAAPVVPRIKPKDQVVVIPAGFQTAVRNPAPAPVVIEEVVHGPSPKKLEANFQMSARRLAQASPLRNITPQKAQLAEENCLARAIYFEARSESELGQLAVAKVIINRSHDPAFPKTICGVVYQGATRNNSCQFSFACDGSPDQPKSAAAWAHAKYIAQKAMAGDKNSNVLAAATFYHADYVQPKWARNMKRLARIGRHIFYSN